jgi:D-alanyl-D-alanine carboxypeptidase
VVSSGTESAPAQSVITKANKTASAVRIYWQKQQCDGYQIYIYKNSSWIYAGTVSASTNNFRISGLSPSTKYGFTVRAFNKKQDGSAVYGEFAENLWVTTKSSVTAEVSAPEKAVISKTNRSATAVRVYWNKQNCDGYQIYIYKNGSWVYAGAASGTTDNFRISGLAPSTKYGVTVRAFNKKSDGTSVFGAFADNAWVTTKSASPTQNVSAPGKVSVIKTSASYNAVRLTWAKLDCDGYEVYMYKNSAWVSVGTVSSSSDNLRITNLPEGTTCYFTVRAYRNSGDKKVYGEYTDVVTVKTKSHTVTKNGATYIKGILIANKSYPLSSSYNPGGLTTETSAAFKRLQQAAKNDGINLWISSGFRTYERQQTLYNNYVARDGKQAADKYSARPGYSEHQTGLALDVNNPSSSFDDTNEAKWLASHCADYGFIIRYPKGKESSTGFTYESWHIRYVGKTLAKKLTNSNQTLEEYLGITSVYAD